MTEGSATNAGTITIGNLEVNRLGYGAMRLTGSGVWGPPADREGARALLRRTLDLGVNLIDTADSYGPEVNEDLIAEALYPYPDGLVIATKGGYLRTGPGAMTANGRPEHLKAACEASLRRLRLDCIDLYQLHTPDRGVPYEESVGALAQLQSEGKIRHIGVSNVATDRLERALGSARIVSVQNRYNVADRTYADILAACEQRGIAFLAWAPLGARGTSIATNAVARIAASRGVEPAQVALAWLLAVSPAMVPIPGTSSLEHLEHNVAAAALKLSAREMAELEKQPLTLDGFKRRLRARVGSTARRMGVRR